jgi:O-antigen/teichoic acid export membrane protein
VVRALWLRLSAMLRGRADITGAVATGYVLMATTAVVNILMVPVYLSAIGSVGFGVLMMLLALSSYAAISVLWLTGGVTRGLGAAHARGAGADFAAIWAAGKWGALAGAGAVAMLVGLALLAFPNILGAEARQIPDLHLAIVLFLAQLAVAWCYSIDRVAFNVSGHQTLSNLVTIGQQAGFGVLAYAVLKWHGGLSGVMAALLASHVLALLSIALMRQRMAWSLRWRLPFHAEVRRELRAMLSSEGSAFVLFGIVSLSLQADVLFVGLFGGAAVAAEFALVWKIAEITIQGLWRLPDVFQPSIIRLDTLREQPRLRGLLRRIDRLVLLLAVMAGLAYMALGPWIVVFWVGAEHAPRNHLLFVLAGAAIVWLSLARLPISAAFVTGRLRAVLQVMTAELAGKLAVMGVLLPSLGALAPLIAVNAVHALGVAYGYRRLLARLGAPVAEASEVGDVS